MANIDSFVVGFKIAPQFQTIKKAVKFNPYSPLIINFN